MKNSKIVELDLDAFLVGEPKQQKRMDGRVSMPDSDKITVVGIFVDDSGSIANSGLENVMKESVNLCINALRSAKGSDFFLDIRGFKECYYKGLLKDMSGTFGSGDNVEYIPNYSHTPIVQASSQHYCSMRQKVDEYTSRGIPASVAYAVMTDGQPKHDIHPNEFAQFVRTEDYIVGMGVCSSGSDASMYRDLFREMGIRKVMTPRAVPSEIRHAFNEFSRSAVAGALR